MPDSAFTREVLGEVVHEWESVLDRGDIKNLLEHVLNPWVDYAKKRNVFEKQYFDLAPETRELMEKKLQASLLVAKNAGHTTDRLPRESKCLSFIDPAGGGTQSDYAVVSIIITPPGAEHPIYIVGMGCYGGPTRAEPLSLFFKEYWEKLEENPLFQLCAGQHYVGIERNYGGTFNSFMCMKEYVQPYLANRIIPLKDPNEAGTTHKHKHGVLTNPMIKFNGVQILTRLISQGEKGIVIARGVATAGRPTVADVLFVFGIQLRRLRGKNGQYSAKQAPNQKDALITCLILCLFWALMAPVITKKVRRV